jgi:hypothetical protein
MARPSSSGREHIGLGAHSARSGRAKRLSADTGRGTHRGVLGVGDPGAGQTCGVASWAQFEAEAPELAEVAARLWPGVVALHRGADVPWGVPCFAVSYLATVRRDGGPRLHPFCPILAGGRLFAAIPRSSPKGWDLRREPRCVIHALPGPEDDEFCVRATACEVTCDRSARAMVHAVVVTSGVGGMIESVSRDPVFEFDLLQVDVARWLDIGQPGTCAVRQQWRAHRSASERRH